MHYIILILTFFASAANLLGQNKKIVVYIDTLHVDQKKHFHLCTARTIVDYDSPFVWVEKKIDSIPNNYSATKDSIFTSMVFIQNDSTDILIPLDNEGGFLEISNVYLQKFDTIKIRNWKVFSNCYPDTFIISRNYYKRNPYDTLPNSFKFRKKISITHKQCFNSTPETICFNLNNVNYCLQTKMIPVEGIVIWSHGYNKDVYKLKDLNPKRKLIYRATMRETKKYIDKATLKL